jgi:hypothetical protein
MAYTGRCSCGAVTATIQGEALWVRQCWCVQCQKIAAGSATTNALFRTDGIDLQGTLAWNRYVAESGSTVEQGFCAQCGTHVIGRNSARHGACVIRAGFIDAPNDLRPTSAIWLDDAPVWAKVDPELETWPRQPPVPKPAG